MTHVPCETLPKMPAQDHNQGTRQPIFHLQLPLLRPLGPAGKTWKEIWYCVCKIYMTFPKVAMWHLSRTGGGVQGDKFNKLWAYFEGSVLFFKLSNSSILHFFFLQKFL
ncbi:MAG: hypothetical protein A4S09_02115 [Proteobacteria bacterium SG_bin7]|nr:MAG: hypothetical protein A4S09_02115 [Proteobacteria bacterium SG_bin7]